VMLGHCFQTATKYTINMKFQDSSISTMLYSCPENYLQVLHLSRKNVAMSQPFDCHKGNRGFVSYFIDKCL